MNNQTKGDVRTDGRRGMMFLMGTRVVPPAFLAWLDSELTERHWADSHAAELEEQRLRLAHALAAGKMSADVYYKVDTDLAERLNAERQRILDLTHTIEATPDVDDRRAAIAAIARDFGRIVKVLEPPAISSMLQRAGIRIYCDGGVVTRIEFGG